MESIIFSSGIHSYTNQSQPTASVTSTVSPTPSPGLTAIPTAQAQGGGDTTIPAMIAGIVAIIVALIGGFFLLRNTRLADRLARNKIEYERTLREQEEAREQNNQRNAQIAEALRMERVKRERIDAYRVALHRDLEIANLRLLNHNQPLDVLSMYVPIRVHRETMLKDNPDLALVMAEKQQDPIAFIRANQKLQERRYSDIACDPEEAIRMMQASGNKRCIIMGDPGAGKSTLLKYLALRSADKQLKNLPDLHLPIHIELHRFTESGKDDLLDFAAHEWVEKYGFDDIQQAREAMEENLGAGKALLLLDALDETMIGSSREEADASYRRVSEAIRRVATDIHFSSSPIIITARKAVYQRRTLQGFSEFEMVDFRPEDIERFVNNWFKIYRDPAKEAKARDLNDRLKHNPRMQALAANPLLLSLIVTVYENSLDLPINRANLYRECVEALLAKWDASRDILRRRKFTPKRKSQVLEQIAVHFLEKRQHFFPESELEQLIKDFLPSIQPEISSREEDDDIFRALWRASRRVGVRVFIAGESPQQKVEVVKFEV